MWSITFAIFVLAVCVWILWRKKQFSVLKELGIPGPEPSLFFGNLLEISKKTPLVCHREWVQKYGKIVGYYFGAKPIVLVTDLELLKKIEVSDFHKFVNRPNIFCSGSNKPRKGDGCSYQLTNLRDKRWKEIRSLLTPSFTTSKMKLMSPIINNAIDTLIENIDEKATKKESFDIYKMYQGLTMDVIGRTAFGIQTDCQRNPDDPLLRSSRVWFSGHIGSFMTVLTFSFPELGDFWRLVARVRLMFRNRGVNPVKQLLDAVGSVIKERRSDDAKRRNDLLQTMIDARMDEADLNNIQDKDLTAGDEEVEKQTEALDGKPAKVVKLLRRMHDYEILDNAVLFFLAGYETTSTALGFTTHFLTHYPEIQEKIRAELNDLIKKEGTLDYTSVQQLQYLDQVLNESLRMYPPIYLFVNRETGEDFEFKGVHLKKGLPVQVPVHLLQHDEELWPDPEKFDPERFSPENRGKQNPLTFQAFGAGPRNCVGMRFAQMEAKLALARILQKYKLVACEETDKLDLTLKVSAAIITPGKGVNLKAVPV